VPSTILVAGGASQQLAAQAHGSADGARCSSPMRRWSPADWRNAASNQLAAANIPATVFSA